MLTWATFGALLFHRMGVMVKDKLMADLHMVGLVLVPDSVIL